RGAHAGREQHRVLAALEGRELALDGAPGGIAVAAVLVALEAALLVGAHLGRVGEGVGRGLVDRGGERVALAMVALAAMDGARRVARPPLRRRSGQRRIRVGSRPAFTHGMLLLAEALSSGPREARGACKHRKSPRSLNAPGYGRPRGQSTEVALSSGRTPPSATPDEEDSSCARFRPL